jgi:hypothetical protein
VGWERKGGVGRVRPKPLASSEVFKAGQTSGEGGKWVGVGKGKAGCKNGALPTSRQLRGSYSRTDKQGGRLGSG